MDVFYYLFGIALFIAVVLLIEGAYLSWNATKGPEVRRLERRLQAMSAAGSQSAEMSLVKQRLLADSPALHGLLLRIPRIAHIDKLLLQSGLRFSVAEYIGGSLVCVLLAFMLLRLINAPLVLAIPFALASGMLPTLYVVYRRQQRLALIEHQLPDAVDLIGRALRAGHAFPTGVKMVADEMPEPIASEFRIVFDEVNYGISMQDALINLAHRVPSMDLKYFIIGVLIQRDTGGNLAELLDNTSAIIRARLKLLGTIRVLSAEGRLSAWILSLLPFATALMIQLVNPGFMDVLWNDIAGRKTVISAVVLMIFGVFWMRKIIRIRL